MEHTHIIGKTGTGKSTLTKQHVINDIIRGDGVLYLDPTGHDIDDILNYIPRSRRKDTILFDPSDYEYPLAWNPLEDIDTEHTPFAASAMLESFKDAWGYTSMVTPTLDQYLYTTIVALIEARETLVGIKFMLTNNDFRRDTLQRVSDPFIKDFFNDYEAMTSKERRDETRSTLNKIGLLLTDTRIRYVIGQRKSAFSMFDILSGKILLVRLPVGKLGMQKTAVLGSLMLSQFYQSALQRPATIPFHVYIDRCDLFGQKTLIEMLSMGAKYNLSLTLSHQYLAQLSPELQTAILGNTATQIVFTVSNADAAELVAVHGQDNVNIPVNELPRFTAGVFRGRRLADRRVIEKLGTLYPKSQADIRTDMRRNFSRPRSQVAKAIAATYRFA